MTALFIHGVPDTGAVWNEVRGRIEDFETQAPNLPGFGSPVPAGFGCTKEEYAEWIIRHIETIGRPVDLVGHDWGAILVQRVASIRPDLVHTWAAGGGPVDEDYEWHSNARIWQTEGAGERWWKSKGPLIMGIAMSAAGVPMRNAFAAGKKIDARMKKAILALYRSACQLGDEWSPGLDNLKARGLVFWGAKDPFCPILFGQRLSERTGASFLELDCGHWTPQQRPAALATALRQLWTK
jgi:pimeloyl-ACP methyl ester carboxylesterase